MDINTGSKPINNGTLNFAQGNTGMGQPQGGMFGQHTAVPTSSFGVPSGTPTAPQAGVISLKKGDKISLTKTNPTLDELLFGLGWDPNKYDSGEQFDLDAMAFMLGADGKVISPDYWVWYNNKKSACGSVVHSGDNRDGQGDGDDEKIMVKLSQIPAQVQKLVFTVSIDQAAIRHQTFGRVNNAFIRIADLKTGEEKIRYDLTEDSSSETVKVLAELYRHNGEWKFAAVGDGWTGVDLIGLCAKFGLNVSY